MANISPAVSEVEGRPVPARRQAVQTGQGQVPYIEWVVRDDAGRPIDLTSLPLDGPSLSSSSSSAEQGSVRLRVMEVLSLGSSAVPAEITGEGVNPTAGLIRAKLTDEVTRAPGIYLLEWSLYTPGGELEYVSQGHLIVNRSLALAGRITGNGPPTTQEIRLHLRDSDPGENFLIDVVEFDLAELAACIERPVTMWNEAMPPISRKHTTVSFPHRGRWLDGIIAGLYSLAAHHYRRNSKKITAASGVNLDDKEKAMEYEQKAQLLWQEYRRWIQRDKASLNAEACFGSTDGCY